MTRMNLHAAMARMTTVMLTAAVLAGAAAPAAAQSAPPADDASARVRLEESSRHGEYVDIAVRGQATPVRAFVVYPEIATKAAVVVIAHDSDVLSDWIRGVADQLAADGFIAIAPEVPAGKIPNDGDASEFPSGDDSIKASAGLPSEEHYNALRAVHVYGMKLPASTGKAATILLLGPPRAPENWANTVANLRRHTQ